MKRKAVIISILGKYLTNKEKKLISVERPWGIILFKRNIFSFKQTKRLIKSIKKASNNKNFPVLIDELIRQNVSEKVIDIVGPELLSIHDIAVQIENFVRSEKKITVYEESKDQMSFINENVECFCQQVINFDLETSIEHMVGRMGK